MVGFKSSQSRKQHREEITARGPRRHQGFCFLGRVMGLFLWSLPQLSSKEAS